MCGKVTIPVAKLDVVYLTTFALVSETPPGSNFEEKVDAASGNQTKMSTNADSPSQNSRKRKLSGSSRDIQARASKPNRLAASQPKVQ